MMLPNRIVLFCLLAVVAIPSFAVELPVERDVDDIEYLIPHHETAYERSLWTDKQMPTRGTLSDPPPVGPVRNVAEWEPATGVMVRYPLGLPYNLLQDFDDDVTIHCVVSSGNYASAQSSFQSNGIDMGRVEFLIRSNDSIWTRDYGPWFVFDGNGDIAIIDHTYNRPYRPNDNMIPVYFGQQQQIPVHSHDMYHTGGNYMTDGSNFSMSTVMVYSEASGMSNAQVDQLMADYYGIETYNTLEYIESGGIHHIDTWAKFLDEENVLLKEVWNSHHTYSTLEQRATLLASLQSSTGRNYQVHRIYCYDIGWGDPASYTNSLILNKNIYVPIFGDSTHDANALAVYQSAAPGYNVRGYEYSGFITDDALHCRTKGVYDKHMLRVEHIPISGTYDAPVAVEALIDDRSETSIPFKAVYYRFAGGSWQMVLMSSAGMDNYIGTIPSPENDTTVDYYIHAADASGRIAGMPRTEPAHYYTFNINANDLSDVPLLAQSAKLNPNYPNPFNPSTTFSFELKYSEQVRLYVLDARGRQVRKLIDGTECQSGLTEINWNGKDDSGRELPSGTYLFVLEAAGMRYNRPATLLK
jgi:agmatine deiminase